MIVVVEVHPNTPRLFRFVCSRCGEQGAYHPSLTDAERSGERHAKFKHGEVASA